MNKQTIITILLALVAMTGQGQEIKKVAATPEDFMEHMALCGYEVYTYDISSLRDSVSGFTIVIREYNQHGMIDEKKLYGFRTKTMISDFNEKDQQEQKSSVVSHIHFVILIFRTIKLQKVPRKSP